MQKRTVAFSSNVSNVFFHILTKCNLSCSHCYIDPEQHGSNSLDLNTIYDWLGLFAARETNANLVLLGGEPTMHKGLPLIIKSARTLGYSSITIDTNGFLFHNILDKVTPEELDFISFSLDGATASTNDSIRGKGSFEAVISGIAKAHKKGFSCSMIYTISNKNIHELSDMTKLVAKLPIKRFFIQVIGLRGTWTHNNETDKLCQVEKATWVDLIPKIASEIAQKGIIVTYPKVFLNLDEPFVCGAKAARNYFIFPNGRVYQCPICENFPLHSFNIENNNLVPCSGITEKDLFDLNIPEGCVTNKLIQPGNLSYDTKGEPMYKIACCMLKEEIAI